MGRFSNFYPFPIVIDDIEYPTTEHWYQATKFMDKDDETHLEYIKLISKQSTPNKAKILARQKIGGGYKWRTDLKVFIKLYLDRKLKVRDNWDNIKNNVMRRIIYYKFSDVKLNKILLSTGDGKISEHTTRDLYWGDGGNSSGKNMLGKILVETRAILSGKYPKAPTDTSNWIIPGILIASDYPSKHKGNFRMYNDSRIDTYINLMTEKEISISKNIYGLQHYKKKELSVEDGIVFYCPIPDRKVIEDSEVLKLAKIIVSWLGLGKKILVHCLGGKGRSGTILGVVLALVYNIDYDEVLSMLARSFKTRIIKGKYPTLWGPQTMSQRSLKRIISSF